MIGFKSALMLFVAMCLALLGCGYLALSQAKHRKIVMMPAADRPITNVARSLGWVFIAASVLPCVMRDGFGFAALLWPLIVATAALVIALVLAYRPRILRILICVTNLTTKKRAE